jgi:hypothetical protein
MCFVPEVSAITLTSENSGNLSFWLEFNTAGTFFIYWGKGKLVTQTASTSLNGYYTDTYTAGDTVKVYGSGIKGIGAVDINLTSLDVSACSTLTQLDCKRNKLTELDVSKNTALTTLWCNNNRLTSLDMSKNVALTGLFCNSDSLTTLDVSKNARLVNLICEYNQLSALDISNNTALSVLFCFSNKLTMLDLSQNRALTNLHCAQNRITALDLTKNTLLKELACEVNQLTTLDVSKNDVLTSISCNSNKFSFATLPQKITRYTTYYYAPQAKLITSVTNGVVDLSSQFTAKDVSNATQTTVYKWYTRTFATLTPGIDYMEAGGVFTFLKNPSDSVFCIMTNAAFPDFNSNALRTVNLKVIVCTNPTSGGTIAANQSGCSPFDPAEITSSTLPAGHNGTLEYKWQSSTTSSATGFTDITGTNAANYNPGSLTQTTWYKRLARAECMTDWSGAVESNAVIMDVNRNRLYVTETGNGAMDGSDWDNAFPGTQLQTAIHTAPAEVWVASGTYLPTIEVGHIGNRYKTFCMKDSIAIYGGFVGDETSLVERTEFGVGGANESILSGDLNGDDVVAGEGETLTITNNSENCYHVFYHAGNPLSNALLDGFTIKGGNANSSISPFDCGGGMYNDGSSPMINKVTFMANNAQRGGGMYNSLSRPLIINSLFILNYAPTGGGMFSGNSIITITNSTFTSNKSGLGGGMYDDLSSLTLNNCIIWGNTADNYGNQIYKRGGATTLNYSCLENGSGDVSFKEGASDRVHFVTDENCINIDPEFADVPNGDFRVQASSPCVNTGNNEYAQAPNTNVSEDIRGEVRIQNTTIDMGAYEWTSGIDPGSVPNDLTIHQSLSETDTECFGAYNTIVVAGGGTSVNFVSGSTATLIAGQSIRFLPGFHAETGSNVHAWITETASFCNVAGTSSIVSQPDVKSVDLDKIKEVQEIKDEMQLKVYPNPSNGQFRVAISGVTEEHSEIQVYNLHGKVVYSGSMGNQATSEISIDDAVKGLYILKVTTGGNCFSTKIIIQ